MEVIVAVLIGLGCASAGAWVVKRRRQRRAAQAPAPVAARNLDRLAPDDILSIDGVDWLVAGVGSFEDGVRCWQEARLLDASREGWFIVGRDDAGAVLGQVTEGIPIGQRPPAAVEHQGVVMSLCRQGAADGELVGDMGVPEASSYGYWDYDHAGEERYWIRGGEGSWRQYAGKRMPRHLVTFLPGS